MKKVLAVLLCLCFPISAFAAENSYRVAYEGGSLQNAKPGTSVILQIEGSEIKITQDTTDIATIPAAAITEISYGQDVRRRVGEAVALGIVTWGVGGLLALSKSKKHFIGLTWDNNGAKGGFAFRADKNDYRGILMGLEGVTGKKAVDSKPLSVKN